MPKRPVSAIALVVGVMVAWVLGTTGTAYAGNTTECVTVGGIDRGCIVHLDDGDEFAVCDTYADGAGVYGAVQEKVGDDWVTRDSQVDGGDEYCDFFHHDVTEEDYDKYRLKICWEGICEYDAFRE